MISNPPKQPPPSALDAFLPDAAHGHRWPYNWLETLSEIDVYHRWLDMQPFDVDGFWQQCSDRDVELMLDLTGNLDAPL